MPRLGVNIDHVATVRQARQTVEPDPVWAAVLAQLGGADGITAHLREDRRHIQERDLRLLKDTVRVKLNLESSVSTEMIDIALQFQPEQVCLVPERREEVTTEGGLDVVAHYAAVEQAVKRLQDGGIDVSLFLDPSEPQIEAAAKLNVQAVELHTGKYANQQPRLQPRELAALARAGELIVEHGIELHAGHGLTYQNVKPLAKLPRMAELNIGHSIVSRALMVGMERAVREMKALITGNATPESLEAR